jgi:hypothetical protein
MWHNEIFIFCASPAQAQAKEKTIAINTTNT